MENRKKARKNTILFCFIITFFKKMQEKYEQFLNIDTIILSFIDLHNSYKYFSKADEPQLLL